MNFVISFILKYWKIWLPAILVMGLATFVYAQQKKIDGLREARNVAEYQQERAEAENKKLLDDLAKLNRILVDRENKRKQLEADYQESLQRLRALSEVRPDVRVWADTRLPSGMWAKVRNGGEADTATNKPVNPEHSPTVRTNN